jgi:hypothetical protein
MILVGAAAARNTRIAIFPKMKKKNDRFSAGVGTGALTKQSA